MSLVLVVDDEPAVLEVLGEVLADLGHEVMKAYDGQEALERARARRPDLVVTDHMMPRLSGADLCRQLRLDPQLADVPAILLSAALSAGTPDAQAFLSKPFELSQFEALIERVLREAKPKAGKRRDEAPEPTPEAVLREVAEQLSGPLARGRGVLEGLLAGAPGSPGAGGQLAALEVEFARIERLRESLRDAAALVEGTLSLERERQDVGELLRRAVRDFESHAPRRQVHLALPAEPVQLSVDAPRMQQMVEALLGSVGGQGEGPLMLEVTQAPGDASATLHVRRHGQQAQEAVVAGAEGSSVRLFIAGALARLHRGSLWVDGAGASSLRIVLPRA